MRIIRYGEKGDMGVILSERQGIVTVAPLQPATSKKKRQLKDYMTKGKLNGPMYINCQKITTLDTSRIKENVGYVTKNGCKKVCEAIVTHFAKHISEKEVAIFLEMLSKNISSFAEFKEHILNNITRYKKPVKTFAEINEGDILLVNFNSNRVGNEIEKIRYAVVVCCNENTMMVAPISSRKYDNKSYHQIISSEASCRKIDINGIVMLEQIKAIYPYQCLIQIGSVTTEYLTLIKYKCMMMFVGKYLNDEELLSIFLKKYLPQKGKKAINAEEFIDDVSNFLKRIRAEKLLSSFINNIFCKKLYKPVILQSANNIIYMYENTRNL